MDESERTRPPINRLARAVLRLFAAPRVNMREDYERVRRLQRHVAQLPLPGPRVPYREVTETSGAHPITCRVFEPVERRREDVLLFFHGGGWVTGDIESYTPACSTMAELTGCTVVSVDYRLAPEHPFPAGLEDCLHITRLLLAEPQRVGAASTDRIVLVGDSAGGNLAAVVSQQLRDEARRAANADATVAPSPTVGRQILLYPVTHWDHDPATSPYESVRTHGRDLDPVGPGLVEGEGRDEGGPFRALPSFDVEGSARHLGGVDGLAMAVVEGEVGLGEVFGGDHR